MTDFTHICRDDHIEIGHRDSSNEMCPLCRAISALQYVLDDDGLVPRASSECRAVVASVLHGLVGKRQ